MKGLFAERVVKWREPLGPPLRLHQREDAPTSGPKRKSSVTGTWAELESQRRDGLVENGAAASTSTRPCREGAGGRQESIRQPRSPCSVCSSAGASYWSNPAGRQWCEPPGDTVPTGQPLGQEPSLAGQRMCVQRPETSQHTASPNVSPCLSTLLQHNT